MKLTYKSAVLGIAAGAALMLGTATIAGNMGQMGDGMGGEGGMGGMMMAGPMPNLAAIDADKDGKITKDELAAYRAARVAAVDGNGDGKLSADELVAMHVQAVTETAKSMADRMIESLDTDGDKLLSVAEMAGRAMPMNMFDRVDANGDGSIDQAEIDSARERMMERGGQMGGRGKHSMGDHDGMGNGGMGNGGMDNDGMGNGGMDNGGMDNDDN